MTYGDALYNYELHRLDGPAVIWVEDLVTYYTKDNKCRTERHPDITHIRREVWYKNGFMHRLDGPAVIQHHSRGIIQKYWRINGLYIPQLKEWCNGLGIDMDNPTEDDAVMIAMQWGNWGKVI